MLTQEMVTVLEIALIANAIVVACLIVAPRLRNWASRRSLARTALIARAIGDPPPSQGSEASQPWFAAPSTHGSSNGSSSGAAHLHRIPAERPVEALPAMGSPSTWATWLDEEAARTVRYQRPITIVLAELAGLDRLADRIGSAAADRLIPPVASTIRRNGRAADRLARLSPTRFGVLLVETDEVSAINYTERIRSDCDVWLAAGAVSLRLSVGWAEIRPDRTVEASVREAEQRLLDDRRRTEPADPVATADGREGLSGVLQPSHG